MEFVVNASSTVKSMPTTTPSAISILKYKIFWFVLRQTIPSFIKFIEIIIIFCISEIRIIRSIMKYVCIVYLFDVVATGILLYKFDQT